MLRSDWVESIHDRLLVRYGDAWVRKWEGINPQAVAADWADQLSGLTSRAISHALANLPATFPPNAAEFKALALGRPEPAPLALPAPAPDPERVAKLLAAIPRKQQRDMLAWARWLKDRDSNHKGIVWNGKAMTHASRVMYRAALENGSTGVES